MLLSRARVAAAPVARALSTSAPSRVKVAVLGGAGGIGQPLSLLLKNSRLVTQLSVYDIAHAKGVASDLSHISSPAKVTGHVGPEEIGAALKDAKVVVIPAGVPRKPGMTRDDLFNTNANIVKQLAAAVGTHCPKAVVLIISNPVNSTVAIAAEVLKKMGVYDPRKVCGVTTLDIVRARTFVAEAKGIDVTKIDVPVIGGHAGGTILPLLSRTTPATKFTDAERDKLTLRIQNGGTEVVEAKAGTGSATLSMAQAALEMTEQVIRGLKGEKVQGITMVENSLTECKYFAVPVEYGPNGVEKILGLGPLSDYETQKLKTEVIPELKSSITKGEKFAHQ